jgi:hypothetical protein
MRPLLLLLLTITLGGCSLFHVSTPADAPQKKKGFTLWPFGQESGDATPYLEYRRTRSEGETPVYALTARNSHQTKTITGQIRTTLDTVPNESKVVSDTFTLAPNEEKKLLVYPVNSRVTYEVTATFKE